MKVHALLVQVGGAAGHGYSSLVRYFEHERDAKEAAAEMGALIKQLAEGGKIMVADASGRPRVVCTVGEFLTRLGVDKVGPLVMAGEVHGGLILSPPSGVLVS